MVLAREEACDKEKSFVSSWCGKIGAYASTDTVVGNLLSCYANTCAYASANASANAQTNATNCSANAIADSRPYSVSHSTATNAKSNATR